MGRSILFLRVSRLPPLSGGLDHRFDQFCTQGQRRRSFSWRSRVGYVVCARCTRDSSRFSRGHWDRKLDTLRSQCRLLLCRTRLGDRSADKRTRGGVGFGWRGSRSRRIRSRRPIIHVRGICKCVRMRSSERNERRGANACCFLIRDNGGRCMCGKEIIERLLWVNSVDLRLAKSGSRIQNCFGRT